MEPMTMYAVAAGVSAVSGIFGGIVSGNNAREDAERHNRMLEARKAWLLQEKIMSKRIFEIQTFSRYYGENAAGANRLASAIQRGQSTSTASAINA